MATKQQEKIWTFDVTDPTLHPSGFTIYKVICRVFPISSPESLTEIVVWKRYNDFKQLYKMMLSLHKSLHRRQEFPAFAKPKLFGRFDGIVIEERRSTAMDLLLFIGRLSYLYKSQAFLRFLEGGKVSHGISGRCLKPSKLDILNPENTSPATVLNNKEVVTQPQSALGLLADQPKGTSETSSVENSQEQSEEENKLDGVWNYPQIPDNISLNSFDDTDDTDDIETQLSASLPETELSLFDPLCSVEDTVDKSEFHSSNSWLLAAMETCADMDKDDTGIGTDSSTLTEGSEMANDQASLKEHSASDITDVSSEDVTMTTDTENWSEFDPLYGRTNSRVEYGRGDLDLSFHLSGSFSSNSSASSSSPRHQSGISPAHRKRRAYTGNSVSSMELGGKDGYICSAANQICLAQECEANAKYEMAFSYYKNGVGILLQGVQSDGNKARRDAVRRKTAQYLMKAEDLYNHHLTQETVDERRWATDGLSPMRDMDPCLTLLKSNVSELRNFRVLGTIDKVILVLDKATDETYILKAMHKSSVCSDRYQTILPTSCPYMVNLYKFYETDNAFYLLLQYANGGKLWNYIGGYLQHGNILGRERGVYDGTELYGISPSSNIYTGIKLHGVAGNSKIQINCSQNGTKVMQTDSNNLKSLELSNASPNSTIQRNRVESGKGDIDLNIWGNRPNVKYKNINENNRSVSFSEDTSIKIVSSKMEMHDGVNSAIDITSSNKNYQRYTSISSDENVDIENDQSLVSHCHEPREGESQFSSCLDDSRKSLTCFSINSVDSSESGPILENYVSDNFRNIEEEDCDNHLDRENKTDDIFAFEPLDNDKKLSEFTDTPTIDLDANQIVQNAKNLIKSVDRTLSETDSDLEKSLSRNRDHEFYCVTDVLPVTLPLTLMETPSPRSSSPDDEPSIYDTHKQHASNSSSEFSDLDNSDKTLTKATGVTQSQNSSSQLSGDDVYSSCDLTISKSISSDLREDLNSSLDKDCTCLSESSPAPRSLVNVSSASPSTSLQLANASSESPPASLPLTNASSESPPTSLPLANASSESPPASLPLTNASSEGPPAHLSLAKVSSKELIRSASCEFELRSPLKRSKAISDVFQQLDLAAAGTDQIKLPESSIRKWAAEIVVGLARLHSEGIICRDLKPENILLGEKGHIHLTYFCQLRQVECDLDPVAVEMMYVAPEVLSIGGYTPACDWWSLGALMFELLAGKTLLSCHPGSITSHTQLVIPEHVSTEAQSLLQQLLCYNYRERLGAGLDGAEEVKAHPFFNIIDWNALES